MLCMTVICRVYFIILEHNRINRIKFRKKSLLKNYWKHKNTFCEKTEEFLILNPLMPTVIFDMKGSRLSSSL